MQLVAPQRTNDDATTMHVFTRDVCLARKATMENVSETRVTHLYTKALFRAQELICNLSKAQHTNMNLAPSGSRDRFLIAQGPFYQGGYDNASEELPKEQNLHSKAFRNMARGLKQIFRKKLSFLWKMAATGLSCFLKG